MTTREVASVRYGAGVIGWVALWHLAGVLTEHGPAGLLAGLLLVTVLAAVAVGTRRPAVTPALTRRMVRQRAARTGVPRHRDPDSSGRTRPRGPTRPLAAV